MTLFRDSGNSGLLKVDRSFQTPINPKYGLTLEHDCHTERNTRVLIHQVILVQDYPLYARLEMLQGRANHSRHIPPNQTEIEGIFAVISAIPSISEDLRVGSPICSIIGKSKATTRTRTVDLRFTKPLLCQLSYGGVPCFTTCVAAFVRVL